MKMQTTQAAKLLDQLEFLAPSSSKTSRRDWISDGRVFVNGRTAKLPSEWVESHAEIVLGPQPKRIIHPAGAIPILFEDKYIIVIDKPAGLLSVDKDEGTELSLHRILKDRTGGRERIYPYHRLDQGTSGVILFCKDEGILEKMQDARAQTERLYEALVEGVPEPRSGTWTSNLKEISPQKVIPVSPPEGSHAITHYECVDFDGVTARLHLKLDTGRRHQIRVQTSSAGFPIVGDTLYGSKQRFLGRMGLHARQLEITHPVSGKRMQFKSRVPF